MSSTEEYNNERPEDALNNAEQLFNDGEYIECLRALRYAIVKDVTYLPFYTLSAQTLEALDGEDEQQLYKAVCDNDKDATAFVELGNFYFANTYYDLSQVFYERALQLDPAGAAGVMHDLAISYARTFKIGKAIEILQQAEKSDFWNMYFLTKCRIMNRQVEGVEATIGYMQEFLDGFDPNTEGLDVAKMKVKELRETYARYMSLSDPKQNIRDWQYILYGSIVLDVFESDEYVAGGRYVASWGTDKSIKSLVNRFKQFSAGLSLPLAAVVSLPNRDSEIIGLLLSKQLDLPFSFYEPGKTPASALIVTSDTSLLEVYDEFETCSNGELIFAVNHNWLDMARITPDIIGFMTQRYSFPWSDGGMRINEETGNVEMIEANDDPANVVAAEILVQPLQADETIPVLLDFYTAKKPWLKGIGEQAGKDRYNFMIESPLPGAYFQ